MSASGIVGGTRGPWPECELCGRPDTFGLVTVGYLSETAKFLWELIRHVPSTTVALCSSCYWKHVVPNDRRDLPWGPKSL